MKPEDVFLGIDAAGEYAATGSDGKMEMVGWIKPSGGMDWHRYTAPIKKGLNSANFWMIRVYHSKPNNPAKSKRIHMDVIVKARDLVEAVGGAVLHVRSRVVPSVEGFEIGDAEMLSCSESLCCLKEDE